MKREMYNLLCDEIGGFLGNHDWKGEKNLVEMAQDRKLRQWAEYYGAKPKDIHKALKRIRREDKVLLDFEIGDPEKLEGLE